MRVLICGGGTAGHVYPGLALAEELKSRAGDTEILFVGTKAGLESSVVPEAGYPLDTVSIKGFKREFSLDTLRFIPLLILSIFESLGILREFKPSLVVGMGGYVSFPLVSMAAVLGIPTAIHEQNAYPGLANRLLGRVAKVIAVSYPGTKDYFSPRRKVILTGNPVRRGVRASHREDALRAFGLDSSRRTLLIFGGSRGARRINRAFLEAYDFFRDADDLQIIHITGEGEYDVFLKTMNTLRRTDDRVIYQCHPYLTTIDLAYAAADLVLCRAGATTIAEITAKGIPAVLVPYPYSTAAHQEKNARYLENYGAARVVLDGDLNGRSMYEAVSILIHDDEGLRRMRESSLSLGRPRAAEELASLVEEQSKR